MKLTKVKSESIKEIMLKVSPEVLNSLASINAGVIKGRVRRTRALIKIENLNCRRNF